MCMIRQQQIGRIADAMLHQSRCLRLLPPWAQRGPLNLSFNLPEMTMAADTYKEKPGR